MLRRWSFWLSLMFLMAVMAVVGHRLFDPPDPPLTADEARQALVVFAASDEPMFLLYSPAPVPEQMTEDRGNSEVVFGEYICDLHKRNFRLYSKPKHIGGLCGHFYYDHGVWRAAIGLEPDGRLKQWAG